MGRWKKQVKACGRATQGAALGILTKLHLNRKNWTRATAIHSVEPTNNRRNPFITEYTDTNDAFIGRLGTAAKP